MQFTEDLLPPSHKSWGAVLAGLPETEREMLVAELTDAEAVSASRDWFLHARREQIPPQWSWFIWLVLSGRGFGKALALNTQIPTPTGFKTMGEIQPGDTVFSETGAQVKVIATSPIWLNCDCYEVVFSDGNRVVCNGDHLWTTQDKKARKAYGRSRVSTAEYGARTINTRELKETLLVGRERNHSIECAKPIQCHEADLPIDPYTLGVWLGDGNAQDSEIACEDSQVIEEIHAAGVQTKMRIDSNGIHYYRLGWAEGMRQVRSATTGHVICTNPVYSGLKQLNLIRNKHIPINYLRASAPQRLALLQGLMDSDGYIGHKGICENTQHNERLADDLLELCCSLGLKATKGVGPSRIGYREYGDRHRICFTPYIPVFRLARKLKHVKQPRSQSERQKRRYVVEVNSVKSVPTKCIHVDSPSSLYLFSRAFIPTHNNWAGSHWLINKHLEGHASHSAIIAATASDLRRYCLEGPSGVLSLAPTWYRPDYQPSKSKLLWPGGAETLLFTSEKPDRLRGPNLDYVWCDELAAWRQLEETWHMLQLCLRFGESPQCMVTTTPRPKKILRELVKRDGLDVAVTRGSTYDNMANLSERFVSEIITQYKGTRLERQEIFGELLNEFEGALWSYALLDETRCEETPALSRIAVGVDPAVSAEEKSDLTGIVVAARGKDKHFYILGEHSLRASPDGWARKVVSVYDMLKADVIVAEKNQGGAMVEATIRAVSPNANVKLVHASRGKITRAEPVAALYEQRKVHHVGTFSSLEDEMCLFLPGEIKKSPDRVDALVWAVTELMDSTRLTRPRLWTL